MRSFNTLQPKSGPQPAPGLRLADAKLAIPVASWMMVQGLCSGLMVALAAYDMVAAAKTRARTQAD
jgi:hypothetical protein